MTKTVVVTGGTGALGRVVVDRLVAGGATARVTSRRKVPADDLPREWRTVDYSRVDSIIAGVEGADAIVHCATGYRDVALERRLTTAARATDIPHLVYISIVGVDSVPFAYYRTKLAAERVIERSGVPYTILRTTQFHELVRVLLATLSRAPVMPVLDLPFQPIGVDEVATRLAELAVADPAGRVADMGGPRVQPLRDLARIYLSLTGRHRRVLPVRLPGRVFRGFRAGGHLATDHAVGSTTFEEYLRHHDDLSRLSYRGQHR